MRNAAAHFDDDFDIVAPKRKKAPRRAATGKRGKSGRRFGLSIDMTKVARYAAIGMSATVAIGIMVNALMMQTGRHPAPLFGKSIPLGEAAKAPAKAPVAKLAPVQKVEAAVPDPAPAAEAPVKRLPATESHASSAPRPDPIARLLQGESPAAAAKEAKASKEAKDATDSKSPTDGKTVLGAQRALVKLGFVLKPNGHFGPQTRKAVEMFEKDRHLPVKGELSRRVVKILAAESGLKIAN